MNKIDDPLATIFEKTAFILYNQIQSMTYSCTQATLFLIAPI
ncbi:hypothetical protein [Lysinibacillus xylanilyticus]|nr:hypothetical protein [Lysinibacillus xylanilyticus]